MPTKLYSCTQDYSWPSYALVKKKAWGTAIQEQSYTVFLPTLHLPVNVVLFKYAAGKKYWRTYCWSTMLWILSSSFRFVTVLPTYNLRNCFYCGNIMTEFASYVQCSFNLNSKKNNGVTIYNGLQNIYQGLAK